ncbi:lipopolysaccharide biosynthesis protein [Vibrio breoganii]
MINIGGRLINQFTSSFFGILGVTFFSFLIPFVIVRLYGVDVYGEYSYFYSLILILSIFGRLGFDNAIMYFYPKYGHKYTPISLFLATLGVLLSCLLVFYFDFLKSFLYLSLVFISALSISYRDILFSIFRLSGEVKKYYFSYILFYCTFQLLLVLLLHFYFENVTGLELLCTLVISCVFLALTLLYSKRKDLSSKILTLDFEFLKFSLTAASISISSVLMNRIDILILEKFVSNYDLGIYQIFGQISLLIVVVMNVFNVVFAPKISKLYHSGKAKELVNIYKKSTYILSIVSILIFLILLLSFKIVLNIFSLDEIHNDHYIVYILRLSSQLAFVIFGSVGFMLTMTGNVIFQFVRVLLAMLVNVGLNLLLIPNFGILGAGVSIFTSLFLSSFLGFIFVYIMILRDYK